MELQSRIQWILFNPATHILRAGWRIGIFCVITACFSGAAFFGANLFFPESEIVMSALMCAALIGSSIFMVTVIERRPFYSFGIAVRRRFFLEWGQGLLISGVMMTFIILSFLVLGAMVITGEGFTYGEIVRHLLNGLAFFAGAGFFEELLFRGYIFQTLAKGTNRVVAILVFSISFGLVHLGNPHISVFSTLNIVLAGIFLSLAYFRTGTLWFCTALHIGWNFFQGSVYSLPVSGLVTPDIALSRVVLTGPEWLAGGAFGPEGGVAATVVLIVASFVIWRVPWIKNENPPPAIDTSVLTDCGKVSE